MGNDHSKVRSLWQELGTRPLTQESLSDWVRDAAFAGGVTFYPRFNGFVDVDSLATAFMRKYDRDLNGQLSFEEFSAFCLGLTDEELDSLAMSTHQAPIQANQSVNHLSNADVADKQRLAIKHIFIALEPNTDSHGRWNNQSIDQFLDAERAYLKRNSVPETEIEKEISSMKQKLILPVQSFNQSINQPASPHPSPPVKQSVKQSIKQPKRTSRSPSPPRSRANKLPGSQSFNQSIAQSANATIPEIKPVISTSESKDDQSINPSTNQQPSQSPASTDSQSTDASSTNNTSTQSAIQSLNQSHNQSANQSIVLDQLIHCLRDWPLRQLRLHFEHLVSEAFEKKKAKALENILSKRDQSISQSIKQSNEDLTVDLSLLQPLPINNQSNSQTINQSKLLTQLLLLHDEMTGLNAQARSLIDSRRLIDDQLMSIDASRLAISNSLNEIANELKSITQKHLKALTERQLIDSKLQQCVRDYEKCAELGHRINRELELARETLISMTNQSLNLSAKQKALPIVDQSVINLNHKLELAQKAQKDARQMITMLESEIAAQQRSINQSINHTISSPTGTHSQSTSQSINPADSAALARLNSKLSGYVKIDSQKNEEITSLNQSINRLMDEKQINGKFNLYNQSVNEKREQINSLMQQSINQSKELSVFDSERRALFNQSNAARRSEQSLKQTITQLTDNQSIGEQQSTLLVKEKQSIIDKLHVVIAQQQSVNQSIDQVLSEINTLVDEYTALLESINQSINREELEAELERAAYDKELSIKLSNGWRPDGTEVPPLEFIRPETVFTPFVCLVDVHVDVPISLSGSQSISQSTNQTSNQSNQSNSQSSNQASSNKSNNALTDSGKSDLKSPKIIINQSINQTIQTLTIPCVAYINRFVLIVENIVRPDQSINQSIRVAIDVNQLIDMKLKARDRSNNITLTLESFSTQTIFLPNQPASQSISQTNYHVSRAVNESHKTASLTALPVAHQINKSTDQTTNQSINQPTSQSTSHSSNQSMMSTVFDTVKLTASVARDVTNHLLDTVVGADQSQNQSNSLSVNQSTNQLTTPSMAKRGSISGPSPSHSRSNNQSISQPIEEPVSPPVSPSTLDRSDQPNNQPLNLEPAAISLTLKRDYRNRFLFAVEDMPEKAKDQLLIHQSNSQSNKLSGSHPHPHFPITRFYMTGKPLHLNYLFQSIRLAAQSVRSNTMFNLTNLASPSQLSITQEDDDEEAILPLISSAPASIQSATQSINEVSELKARRAAKRLAQQKALQKAAEKAREKEEVYFEGLSEILAPPHLSKLIRATPARYHLSVWSRVYSMTEDGVSFAQFLAVSGMYPCSMIVFKDMRGARFGGFASSPFISHAQAANAYYGSGESFVFTIPVSKADATDADSLSLHRWSGLNDYFLFTGSEPSFIAMGGGDAYAWRIDSKFRFGTSGECSTFQSPILASAKQFEAILLEVWAPIKGRF